MSSGPWLHDPGHPLKMGPAAARNRSPTLSLVVAVSRTGRYTATRCRPLVYTRRHGEDERSAAVPGMRLGAAGEATGHPGPNAPLVL
jgi:hypothetical protein